VPSTTTGRSASARIYRTVPFLFSADKLSSTVGEDSGAPVREDYGTPKGHFTCQIAWVCMEIGTDAHEDHVGKHQALMVRS